MPISGKGRSPKSEARCKVGRLWYVQYMPDGSAERARARRAARRRREYTAQVVPAGTPKGCLYEQLSAVERLAHMWRLCRGQWLASGRPLPVFSRHDMPGEVFRIGDE